MLYVGPLRLMRSLWWAGRGLAKCTAEPLTVPRRHQHRATWYDENVLFEGRPGKRHLTPQNVLRLNRNRRGFMTLFGQCHSSAQQE